MTTRRLWIVFVWLVALALGLERRAFGQTPPPPPNVLVIVLDDVSWEELANLPLANIRGYAPAARTFTRYYGCPVCSPSRVAMMSGEYPHRHFVGAALDTSSQNVKGMPTTVQTLPEVLANAGYSTALFGKAHVSGLAGAATIEQGRVHGFETWRAGIASNITSPSSHYNWRRTDDGVSTQTTTYSTIAVVDECSTWWAATAGPKFAMLCPMAPHDPFDAPPAALLPPGYVVGTSDRAKYEAALIALDTKLAMLLASLNLADTHVVLVADNGSPHQVPPPNGLSPGYKLTVYEGGVRLPFLWWGPGVLPGNDDTLVQHVDLPRSILDVCGVASPFFADAVSFASVLDGSPAGPMRRQYAYVSRFTPNGGTAPTLTVDNWAVVREDGWKLVQEGSVFRLFNLANDPWEQVGFGPMGPGLAGVTADLLNFRSAVLGTAWPY